jgi:hypothetical protein
MLTTRRQRSGARRAPRIIGHIQPIAAGPEWEIKSVAVMENEPGQRMAAALSAGIERDAFRADRGYLDRRQPPPLNEP